MQRAPVTIHFDLSCVAKKDIGNLQIFFFVLRLRGWEYSHHLVTRHFRALLKGHLQREEQSLLLTVYVKGKVIIPKVTAYLVSLKKSSFFLCSGWETWHGITDFTVILIWPLSLSAVEGWWGEFFRLVSQEEDSKKIDCCGEAFQQYNTHHQV